ncbi:MAG TPA: DinB family protein [Steroidobacteraceae bacterium]
MSPVTLAALESFPTELEKHYAAFPSDFVHWAPPSWQGVPSEPFTAIEQICHVRDIEIEGYHQRFTRTINEEIPRLPSIDSEAVARERNYGAADPARVFADFRAARAVTVALLRGLDERKLARRATFEGYGDVSLRALAHYLCSHDQQHLAGLQWLLGQVDAARTRP